MVLAKLRDFFRALAGYFRPASRALAAHPLYRVAVHEAGHVVAFAHAPIVTRIRRASIYPKNLSGMARRKVRPLVSEDDYCLEIICFLAGLAAEVVICGKAPDRSVFSVDLPHARRMAKHLAGMRAARGAEPVTADLTLDTLTLAGLYARPIESSVFGLLAKCYDTTLSLMKQRQKLLREIAAAMMKKNSLTGMELRALLAKDNLPPIKLVPLSFNSTKPA